MPIPDRADYAINWSADPRVVASGVPFRITVYLTYMGDIYADRPYDWNPVIYFTSSDPYAVLPAPYTYVPADRGFQVFTITLYQQGTQSLRVFAGNGTAASGSLAWTRLIGPFAQATILNMTVQDEYLFIIRGETLPVAATAYNYTVFCIKNGSLVADGSWLPRIVFSAIGDDGASFPPTYTFVPADRGVKVFPVTFSLDTNRVLLKVIDDISNVYRGELMVGDRCTLTGDDSITVSDGVTFNYTLHAKVGGDFQYANSVIWTPNVYVTSSDPAATLLGGVPYQFDATDAVDGYAFTLMLNTPGIHTIDFVADDLNNVPTRKTVTAAVGVTATKITATVIRTSGRNTQISIAATDAAGDVDLTSTATVAIASANAAFVNGVAAPRNATLVAGQVLVTVYSAGANTLTLTAAGLTLATVAIT